MDISLYVIYFALKSHSRGVKEVESLMFLEFGFHAQQSAYVGLQVSETRNEMFGTIGGVAFMKLVLLFCLFVYIGSASIVAPAKVGLKYDKLLHLKYD